MNGIDVFLVLLIVAGLIMVVPILAYLAGRLFFTGKIDALRRAFTTRRREKKHGKVQ